MHSDTENNVKATRTEGVNLEEQPGARRTIIHKKTLSGNESFKLGLCDEKGRQTVLLSEPPV